MGIQNHMGPYCYFGVLPQTTPPPAKMHPNTLTGPDLYTGLQWLIPYDGSDLRSGIELKHIPWIFKLSFKLPARHKLNQVFTGREFQLKAPAVIINYKSHKIKEADDPEVPRYLYFILLKTTIFNEKCWRTGYWPSASFCMRSSLSLYQYTWTKSFKNSGDSDFQN